MKKNFIRTRGYKLKNRFITRGLYDPIGRFFGALPKIFSSSTSLDLIKSMKLFFNDDTPKIKSVKLFFNDDTPKINSAK